MRCVIVLLVLLVLVPSPVAHADSGLHLYIPRLLLDVAVSECPIVDSEYDTSQVGRGVCHLEGTATLAMDWARIVLAGHTPGGFEHLHELRAGDQIVLWDARRVETYSVQLVTVTDVGDLRWLQPTAAETVTLITCVGARRLIVHATREGA